MHLLTVTIPLLFTTLTTKPLAASPLSPRQVSSQGTISYNDYNSAPKVGGDPACGTPYGSLDINHILSLHGNDWPAPYCGLCLQVGAAACDYFLVVDSKGAEGLDLNNDMVSGAVMGISSSLGAGSVQGSWSTVEQGNCSRVWNGVQDNSPALGFVPQLQALIAGGSRDGFVGVLRGFGRDCGWVFVCSNCLRVGLNRRM